MSKKEIDIDKEVERLSRKSDINIKKLEYSFNKQLKRLDKEMDKVLDDKIKVFDEGKHATEDYLNISYGDDTIERYREKLKKM